MVRKVNPEEMKNEIIWLNWVAPFEKEVWWLIIATLFISGFTYQIIEYIANKRNDRTLRRWTMDHLYLSFLNCTQNFAHEPTSLGGRVFAVSFAFWAMLIGGTCYGLYCILYYNNVCVCVCVNALFSFLFLFSNSLLVN